MHSTYRVFSDLGEYMAAGAYEEPERSLFYRKALGIRRYYENCMLCQYNGEKLYPSGSFDGGMIIHPHYMMGGIEIDYYKINDNNRAITNACQASTNTYKSASPESFCLNLFHTTTSFH